MISYYELLGLIKEGKQPNKVKYGEIEFEWDGCNYLSSNNLRKELNMTDVELANIPTIEVIEEKPKKIGKLNIEIENKTTGNAFIRNEHGTKCFLTKHSKIIAEKVNELIEKANYLLEEDRHE